MNAGKKIYFASDQHLGTPSYDASLTREKLFIKWLDEVRHDAAEIYLLGDLFDFWFEYKTVVPKGYVRILGKLAEIRDAGIPIHFFVGNHDLWMFGYFEKELNIPVYHEPVKIDISGKTFFIGHGDGIGPKDHGFKFIKAIFKNRICQWLFEWIHPNIGIGLANYWSRKSRQSNVEDADKELDEEREWQILFAREKIRSEAVDYFIFGHRHRPLDIRLSENSRYINLGDWMDHFTYAVFDGKELSLKSHVHDP